MIAVMQLNAFVMVMKAKSAFYDAEVEGGTHGGKAEVDWLVWHEGVCNGMPAGPAASSGVFANGPGGQ